MACKTTLLIALLLASTSCKPVDPVKPPVAVELRPTFLQPDARVQTTISRITLEDLGCFGPCPRYVIRVSRNGEIAFTNLRPPSSTPDGQGRLEFRELDSLLLWFHANLPEVAKISANVGNCDSGCMRLTIQRDDSATLVWTFHSDDRYVPLWGAAMLIKGVAASAQLSPCG